MPTPSLPPTTRCPAAGHRHRLVDLTGRTAVVTGGAVGIGYYTAEGLAACGAHVVIAGRNADRAHAAQRAIQAQLPDAQVSYQPLDLADLASVRAAAASGALASPATIPPTTALSGAVAATKATVT